MSRNPIPNGAIHHSLAYPYSQLRPLSPITGNPQTEKKQASPLRAGAASAAVDFTKRGEYRST